MLTTNSMKTADEQPCKMPMIFHSTMVTSYQSKTEQDSPDYLLHVNDSDHCGCANNSDQNSVNVVGFNHKHQYNSSLYNERL